MRIRTRHGLVTCPRAELHAEAIICIRRGGRQKETHLDILA